MYKVYRETVDIHVAFESAMKRSPPGGEQVEMAKEEPNVPVEPVPPPELVPQEIPASSRTKRALRPIARALFRLTKPLLKPVAFRFRRYLMDGLQQVFLPMVSELRNEVLARQLSFEQELGKEMAEAKLAISEISDAIRLLISLTTSEISKVVPEINREIRRIAVKLNKIDEYDLSNRNEVASLCIDILDKFTLIEGKLGKEAPDAGLAISEVSRLFLRLDKIEEDNLLGRNEVAKLRADVLSKYTSSERQLRKELSEAKSAISEVLQIFPRLDRIEEYSLANARRVAVNCGPDDIVIKTVVGYVLCAAADPALVALLLDGGELERGTRLLIERLLGPGDTFVDVGANVGLHTLAAARSMEGTGKIVAFEPYGPTMRRLGTTLWFNGFLPIVDLHQSAASNQFGVNKLYLGVTSGHHSLFPLDMQESPGGEPVEVQMVTLDGTIEPGERVDLLKIDAEGAELDVLQGALETIRGNPEIGLIVEFGPSHLKRTGHTEEAWISVFTELGFTYRAIHPLTGVLEEIPFEELKAMESINLFFAQPHSSAWQKARS